MNGILILLAFGIAALSGGNKVLKNNKKNTSIVMEVGYEKTPMNEFEAIFRKNNTEEKIDKEYLDNYTKLFVDFRRKVLYAQELKLDTSAEFKSELAGYRTQLAKPYLTDKVAEDKLVLEAYERMQNEVRVSHVLILLNEDDSDKEIAKALSKIKSLRTKIINGEDFSKLAKEYSDDPSSESNGGDLGYFSVFKMLYPFESAAFNTEVGDVSQPFRTQYGFHILKVVDKRANRGEVKVAHIMIEDHKELVLLSFNKKYINIY
jgi:peptidyl-prolyl cis-trans isomerase SurA